MTATSHRSRQQPARQPRTGHRAWRVVAGAILLVGRLLRGLTATVVLTALVVGLPWALVHYVGWPLPHHVPTWPELKFFLLSPISTTLLLDFLACACWITWFAFTLDVLRCTFDIARGMRWPDLSEAGPMHTLAGVLVGAVLLSVLGNRPAAAPSGPLSAAWGPGSPVVATAGAWQSTASPSTVTVRQAVFRTPTTDNAITDASTPAPSAPVSVIVRAPENGVHDSLWRIAQRTLGDGNRWPEIWQANAGKPQPGGRTFTQPSLVYPGQELALPATATAPPSTPPASMPAPAPAPTPTSAPPATAPPTTTAPPANSPSVTAAPTTHHAPTTATGSQPSTREPGFRWEPDLFVGLGLASAVSAALLIARRRYRARYQPGSGDRDDFPVTPVVYQLRLAHLRAEQDDEFDLDDDLDGTPPSRGVVAPARVIGATETDSDHDPAMTPRLGVRDGREVALNLAVAHGLGLVGAGAPAARALLVTALSTTNGHRPASAAARVIVPAEDLVPLLGRGAAHARLPAALLVADSLDGALDALEAEILVRAGARTGTTAEDEPRSWPTLVLAATVPEHQRTRLQAVLDNGAPFGITGLLLGQWQPGVSAYIRTDGTVSAVSPGLGEALRGARMFRLGDDHTAELLTLLAQAEPGPPSQDAQGDDSTPPTGLPRIVRARPHDNPALGEAARHGLDRAHSDPADPMSDTELEVTAAAQPPITDGELEILAASRPTAPGARLRPSATARPHPAAGGEPQPGDVEDTRAPRRKHGATAAVPTPVTGIAEDDADTARALITISVLGALRVHWHPEAGQEREITGALQPRTQELLVLLALHPGGTTRDTLVSMLWGQYPPARPTNALHTALARMRRDLADATDGAVADIALVDNGHYRLDPAVVHVDYWRFENAMAVRRGATSDAQRIAAYREVVDSYGGPLAEGMSKIEWSAPAREAIRRDALDAVSGLARALVDHDPHQTLDLLEVARAFDPHNELLYRDIMRLQAQLGLADAIPRTLTLLTTRLAEVGDQPSEHAIKLAARLRQRHDEGAAQSRTAASAVPRPVT